MSRNRTFVADRGDHGRRLDLVISRHVAGERRVSRTRVQRWIAYGHVHVDDVPARRPSQRVGSGAIVSIPGEEVPRSPRRTAPAPSLSVIYEDDHLLIANKPPGVVVHPTYGHADGTLMNALWHYAKDWPEGRTPSLVQRLDRDTSGAVLIAKSPAMHADLAAALREGQTIKAYLAVCYGRMLRPSRRIRQPLGPDPGDRRRMIVRADGAEAETLVTRLARSQRAARGLTLVRCQLITGRTHQIRVHLQAEGLPIVGDPVYGSDGWRQMKDAPLAAVLRAFGRQALHAWRLSFVHPVTRLPLSVEANLPQDLTRLLVASGLDGAVTRLGDAPSARRSVASARRPGPD
ncbi:MAG: RluA family pseudouridine synthase [Vicinamibacterales bacterium]